MRGGVRLESSNRFSGYALWSPLIYRDIPWEPPKSLISSIIQRSTRYLSRHSQPYCLSRIVGLSSVGTSIVDSHLRKLFEHLAPTDMGKKKLKAILDYPGPLSTLSAKADVAMITRLIGGKLNKSIHLLRKLRNAVAHSPESFRLQDHKSSLMDMYDLGSGIPIFINRMALQVVTDSFLHDVMVQSAEQIVNNEELLFESPKDVYEHLQNSPQSLSILQEKVERAELAVAVGFICALIVWNRKEDLKSLERIN